MELLVALGIMTLLARVGIALYAMALVRAKNSAAAVMRTLCDACVTTLAFWGIGAAILIQFNNPWFSVNRDLVLGLHPELAGVGGPVLLFYLAMFLTASGVVLGAVAERFRFIPLLISSLVLGALILPITGEWIWIGWLHRRGFVDLAGASALHVTAAVFAAVAAIVVGPRTGKFNRDGSSSMIPGHNLPLAAIGVLVMMVGWIAYVAGASVFRAVPGKEALVAGSGAMNVILSAAAAGLAAVVMGQIRYGKPDILLTLTGFLGGLVAVSGGGVALPMWAAVVIGGIAGVIVPWAVVATDLRARIDDPLGMIAIHGVGGAWGTVAAGIFLPTMDFSTRMKQIGMQFYGLLAIALFAALIAIILYKALDAMIGLRAKEADEFDGLDLAEHDIGAYPDFQQNSIKSYHLREA